MSFRMNNNRMKPSGPDEYVTDYFENEHYKLDKVLSKDHQICLSALTKKNADFIEAVVRLDSNYGADDLLENTNSTRYWFDRLSQMSEGTEFSDAVYNLVTAIDITNSTHLEACENGRKRMAEIIVEYCYNYEGLILAIKQNLPSEYCFEREEHLLTRMCEPMKCRNRGDTVRCNLSFASKFLSYACHYLLNNDEMYPKYDSVVSKMLANYVYVYLGEIRSQLFYQANGQSMSAEEKIDVYLKYRNDIRRILDLPSVRKEGINFNTFDHIVWYCNK